MRGTEETKKFSIDDKALQRDDRGSWKNCRNLVKISHTTIKYHTLLL